MGRVRKTLLACLVGLLSGVLALGLSVPAQAATTYTTGNSCTHNGVQYTASVSWLRNGNYERPTSVSWHSVGSVWNFETQWHQGSYVGYATESYYDSVPTFSGSVSYPSWVPNLYWPGYDDYVLVSFYGPFGGFSHLCTVKVTD